jgi:hypothetical protein
MSCGNPEIQTINLFYFSDDSSINTVESVKRYSGRIKKIEYKDL